MPDSRRTAALAVAAGNALIARLAREGISNPHARPPGGLRDRLEIEAGRDDESVSLDDYHIRLTEICEAVAQANCVIEAAGQSEGSRAPHRP
jgi:hypothetical protein